MDRKRRLMENNNGWPLRSQLLDGAPFYAQLTNSLVLNRGTGSPTYTGATTKTFPDNEGVLRTAIAGEARFVGARRVRNLLPASTEDLSSAGFTRFNATASTDTLTASVGAGFHYTYSGSGSYTAATKYIYSVEVERTNNDWIFVGLNDGQLSYFNTTTGLFGTTDGTVSSASATLVSAGVYRIALAAIPGAVAVKCTVGIANANGGASFVAVGTETIKARKFQLEDITGRADQTTPSEYVSVGVLSAPYHGAGVDGVKYFDTDLSGNPIAASTLKGYLAEPAATNLCLQSNAFTTTWTASGPPTITKNVVGPDGATSAWTLTDGTGGADHITSGNITFTAAAYTASVFIKKTVGATTFPVLWMIDAGTTTTSLCTADTNNGVATVWTANGFGLAMMAGASARCSSYNDNYWRFELTATGTAVAYNFKFGPALTTTANQSSGTFSAATTGSAVFYGAQVELGSSATSYIPTTTTAVARNADALTYTGGDIANIKTLACSFRREAGVSVLGAVTGVNDNTFNHYNYCYLNSATQFKFEGYAGGVEQWNTTASNAYTPGTQFKAASSTATNSILMDLNGTAQTADTVATVPVVTRLDVGHIEGGSQLNGNVGGIYGWTRNLSQSELAAVDR